MKKIIIIGFHLNNSLSNGIINAIQSKHQTIKLVKNENDISNLSSFADKSLLYKSNTCSDFGSVINMEPEQRKNKYFRKNTKTIKPKKLSKNLFFKR